jgi:lipoprotein NlpD
MSRNTALIVVFVFLLQACARTAAPVHQRDVVKEPVPGTTDRGIAVRERMNANAEYHVVKSGDTLYSIAWRYSKDYKAVASWNRIPSPYTIYPGQIVRLKPSPNKTASAAPAKKKGTPLQTETVKKIPPKPTTKTTTTEKKTAVAAKPANSAPLPSGAVKWNWPTAGKVVKSNSPTSKKGIDISGVSGQTIKAAATGDVVYSGSGLFGYGKLIIIKHNETYLSAYAYNSKLLVKEGDRVRAGQPISYMGQDHNGRTVLHFEIRKNGQPINPVTYLPRKSA